MNEAYLCLGGNLGEVKNTFAAAEKLINAGIGPVLAHSSLYRSSAWGMENAPDFYNYVLKTETEMNARQLLKKLLEIEHSLGRNRNEAAAYQNRSIDIDILFFNGEIINEEHLHIPHPRLQVRKFVLVPLNEIAADLTHPVLKKTISTLLMECTDKETVIKA